MHNNKTALAYAALLGMPLFYSTNVIIGRALVGEIEPITLAFFRWLLAAAMLAPFAVASSRTLAADLWNSRKILFLLAFLGMCICGAGVYVALTVTTATNGTLIYTASPALIILIEWLFLKRKVSIAQILGVFLAISGIFVIVIQGSLDRLAALSFNRGDLGIALAATSWAIYSVILRQERLSALPVLVSFFGVAVCAVVLLVVPTAVEIWWTGHFPTGLTHWAWIVLLAIVPSVLAFSSFQFGVKTVGASQTALFMYLIPLWGVALSVVFLDEQLHLFHLAGLVGILGGIIMATLPTPRKRTKAPI